MCLRDFVEMVVGGRMIVMSLTRALKTCFCLIMKCVIEKHMRAMAPASFSS